MRVTYPIAPSKCSYMPNHQVPQPSTPLYLKAGSILGPLLFSVLTDDLGDECENTLYLYAMTPPYSVRSDPVMIAGV